MTMKTFRSIAGLLIVLAVLHPVAVSATDGPSYQETAQWLVDRLGGFELWGEQITRASTKGYQLFLTARDSDPQLYPTEWVIDLPSLDPNVELVITKTESGVELCSLRLAVIGREKISRIIRRPQGEIFRSSKETQLTFNFGTNKQLAEKMQRGLSHLVKLAGGGQKDLF